MTPEQVRERGLERIARGDFTTIRYMIPVYRAWLLRQTGNQDEPTPPAAAPARTIPRNHPLSGEDS